MSSNKLLITYVSTFGEHLKISGQLDKNLINEFYDQISSSLNDMEVPSNIRELRLGMFCFALRHLHFRRAVIVTILNSEEVAVEFPDYGHNGTVNIYDLRIGEFPSNIEKTPPLCGTYILHGIINDWKPSDIAEISRKLLHEELAYTIVAKIRSYSIIKIVYNGFDLTDYLVNHQKLGLSIDDCLFRECFLKNVTRKFANLKNTETIVSKVADLRNKLKTIKPARPLRSTLLKSTEMEKTPESSFNKSGSTLFTGDSGIELLSSSEKEIWNSTLNNSDLSSSFEYTILEPNVLKPKTINFVKENILDQQKGVVSEFQNIFNSVEKKISSIAIDVFPDKTKSHSSTLASKNSVQISKKPEDVELINCINVDKDSEKIQSGITPTFTKFQTLIRGTKQKISKTTNYKLEKIIEEEESNINLSLTNNNVEANIPNKIEDNKTTDADQLLRSEDRKILESSSMEYRKYSDRSNATNKFTKYSKCAYTEKNKENEDPCVVFGTHSVETFISSLLNVGSSYEVTCCFVENGPHGFFVQLTSNQASLNLLMLDIDKAPLKRLVRKPKVGMAVLARFYINQHLYRALIVSVKTDTCLVLYVDFGNRSEIKFDDIFEIPSRFLEPKTFAIRCTLSGYQPNLPFNDQLNVIFREIVLNKLFILKRVPSEKQAVANFCEIHLNGINLTNLLKARQDKIPFRFPDPDRLENNERVEIRYIESPHIFYVQKVKNIERFEQIMDACNEFYNCNRALFPPLPCISIGMPCLAYHDTNWFRAEIINLQPENAITVRFVDFGFNIIVHKSDLVNITGEYLLIPRQAIQCKLKLEKCFKIDILNATSVMEMLAQETELQRQRFFAEIFEMHFDGSYTVNLLTDVMNLSSTIHFLQSPICNNKSNSIQQNNDTQENVKRNDQILIPVISSSNRNNPSHKYLNHNKIQKTHLYYERTNYPRRNDPLTTKFKDPKYIDFFRNDADFNPERLNNPPKSYYYQSEIETNLSTDNMNDSVTNDNPKPSEKNEEESTSTATTSTDTTSTDTTLTATISTATTSTDTTSTGTTLTATTSTAIVSNQRETSPVKKDDIDDSEINWNLLIGQKILVTILDITDIYHFKIHIQGSLIEFYCSYGDNEYGKLYPEIAARFKHDYSGGTCILTIMDITPDKMVKVKPVEHNHGHFDICPIPIVYDRFIVKIIYVNSMYRLFAHCLTTIAAINELLKDMSDYYENNGELLDNPVVGHVCAVKSIDENWYRGRIVSINKVSKEVVVFYVDYGRRETIREFHKKDKIKKLEFQFSISSAYAVEINLPIGNIKTTDAENSILVQETLKMLITDKMFKVEVIEMRRNHLIGKLFFGGENIVQLLSDRGLVITEELNDIRSIIDEEELSKICVVEESTTNNKVDTADEEDIIIEEEIIHYNDTQSTNISPEPTVKLPEESIIIPKQEDCEVQSMPNRHKGFICYYDNPNQFHIQLSSNIKQLHNLQRILQISQSDLEPLTEFVNNSPCIVYHMVRRQWCRAKVVKADLKIVKFIDYGDYCFLDNNAEIKEMTLFSSLKPMAIACSLPVIPNQKWSYYTKDIISQDKPVDFNFIMENAETKIIDLYIDGENVADKLIAANFALPLEIPTSTEICHVSNVKNINDFYVQLQNEADTLESINNYLIDSESFEIIKKSYKGMICAAKCSTDNCYYRAKLLAKMDKEYEVLFIDFGKTSSTSDIRKISNEIAKLPPMAKNCSLDLPENLNSNMTVKRKFIEVVDSGQQNFSLKLKKPKLCSIVSLYKDSIDILDELIPLCDQKQ